MSTSQNGRHLLFGGQGPNGTLCHDLWALKGVDESEGSQDGSQETEGKPGVQSIKGESSVGPRWTKLALRGEAPVARAGHALVAVQRTIVVQHVIAQSRKQRSFIRVDRLQAIARQTVHAVQCAQTHITCRI